MNSRFVDRTLSSVGTLLRGVLFAEETAARPGLLQSLDPRVRTAFTLGMLFLALVLKSLPALGVLYGLVLLLAVASRVGFFFFLARTWLFIPFFTVLVVLPSVFSFVTPGEAAFTVGPLTATKPGLLGAALLVSRTAVSVSFAVLLSLTTRHFDLLKVLRWMGIPKVFVMVTGMTYRYIHLLLELLESSHRAVKSRVGNATGHRTGRRLVAWNMAVLWMRSYQLSEEVYGAMRSRGYRGEPVVLARFKTRPWDWGFLALAAAAGIALWAAESGGIL